ncbi:MAG: DUF4390 domain-containing protein [Gammaproteobacteria bacterium]|nr:DUF4390 domain-containing protein [Gammaproteobacteria bacterium]
MPMRRSFLRLGCAAILLCGTALASDDDFHVDTMQARMVSQSLQLTGNVDLELTPEVKEAIANGITMEFVFDVRLYRYRAWLWNQTLENWRLRRQLHYHALSGQYLVGSEVNRPHNRDAYSSLAEALRHIGTIDEVLPLNATLVPQHDYRVGVRTALDLEALPPLLRPVAYTSRAWDLNSGWTTWPLQR